MKQCTNSLTDSQLEEFQQNGYLLLKGILDPVECQHFDSNIIQPALKKYAGIDENDPTTWNTAALKTFATGDYNSKKRPDFVPGVMIRKEDGSDPISDEHSLDLSALNPVLDQLHGGSNSWEWLHTNVGWIHVRFPIGSDDTRNNATENRAHADTSWHVDGGHFNPHYLDSPEQSIVVLPMVRSVGKGGGNTLVLRKSHLWVAHMLERSGGDGVSREVTQDMSDVARIWPEDLIAAVEPCDAGDVLLLHPFVVHAAGSAEIGQPLRIAFNMGIRWRRRPVISKGDSHEERPISFLERSIEYALKESLGFVGVN